MIRGMAFSPPMVRAIRAGIKTQTRRLISRSNLRFWTNDTKYIRPDRDFVDRALLGAQDFRSVGGAIVWRAKAFEYQVGDLTTWQARPMPEQGDHVYVREAIERSVDLGAFYRADSATIPGVAWKWKPKVLAGRYMPTGLARTWLVIKAVRIERLQDISEKDAAAEGMIYQRVIIDSNGDGGRHNEITADRYWNGTEEDDFEGHESAIDAYSDLWQQLHVQRGERWDNNPYVLVTEFEITAAP